MVEFCWCAGAARVGCGPLITSELSHAAQIIPHINMLVINCTLFVVVPLNWRQNSWFIYEKVYLVFDKLEWF